MNSLRVAFRVVLAAMSLTLVASGLVVGPVAAESAAPEKVPAAPVTVQNHLDHTLRLVDAISIVDELDIDAIGYHYENGPVAGEFYPNASKTTKEFLAEFRDLFATEPQVTSIVTKSSREELGRDPGGTNKKDALGVTAQLRTITTGASLDFVASKVDSSKIRSLRDTPDPSATPLARGGGPGEWRPEVVDVEITRDSDRVQFAQIADWGADSSPENTPEGYGVEFEINLYNDKSTGITQPFCELEYWNQFAANWYSVTPPDWMIVASGDTVASELQPYWDTNGLDECSRMTFAVGVRYPQLIEPDEDGHFAYVFWSATETEEDVDRLAASLQLVDDEECVARENSYPPWADIDLPWCMGFWQIAPPAGSNNPRMVLNHDRFIYGPDFCWTSANFGGSGGYVPRTYCGPGINWDAVPMTAVSPKSGSQSNGWDVTITHQSDDLDWSVYPYSSALPAISPNQPADWKNIGQIADVRAWIDGSPVDVSFEGWEFEEALPVNNRFTLSNEAMKVGDGSAMTMAKFFRNGALSFRKGFNADVNWIRLNQLHEMWNPEAFDPFNCVIGSNHEGDDETQRNRVVVGYGLEEQCTFSAAGELNSTAAFGIATHTESSPGYLFHGDLEDGWIPREEHSVWRPSNGSAVVVSYMDTITSTQVPFYSGVQNSESTYVGNTSIPLPGYDSDLPTVEIEVSSQLFTDTSSWDCRWVLEETPACESYRTDFDLNAMHMWPPITQGAGWRELADSGGTIAFTTSQGTPVVLTLLPGSYYSNDLSMPPGPSRPGR